MKACSKQDRQKTRSKNLMNSMYLSYLYTNYSTLYREPLHKESKPNGQHMQPYINAHFVVNTNKKRHARSAGSAKHLLQSVKGTCWNSVGGSREAKPHA